MNFPKVIGNKGVAAVLVFIFVVILLTLTWRCSKAAEADLMGGLSFGWGGDAPVLGLDLRFPQGNALDLYAGTLLWAATDKADTNWSWEAGFRTCRGRFCANLGATYLQRTDAVDGTHANFNLGLSYLIDWHRFESVEIQHISNAGTSENGVNYGRQAILGSFRLQ